MSSKGSEEKTNQRRIDCPVLVTERLVLRPPHVEDMDAIADLANNRRISAMLAQMPYPFTRQQAAEFVKRADTGETSYCIYAITLAETGVFIGSCSIRQRKDGRGIEIVYWLGEPYWQKGYGSEAVNALIDTAFRATDIDELYVSCLQSNVAGRRILQKSGFHLVTTSNEVWEVSGNVTVDHYVLDRIRWIGLRSLSA